jgi:hypothetical protein
MHIMKATAEAKVMEFIMEALNVVTGNMLNGKFRVCLCGSEK